MRAKVKITEISTGQEFLLLVAKMNLKGILVFSPQIIAINSELVLELKLGPQNPIVLKGFVHKVSGDDTSKKGMVIAFLNPSSDTKSSIQNFIDQNKTGGKATSSSSSTKKRVKKTKPPKVDQKKKLEEIKRQAQGFAEPEKTMIVDDTLPALSLQSPDNEKELLVSTKDEENIHHAGDGFMGGETRHVQIHETLTRRKDSRKAFQWSMIYRALGIVLIGVLVILFFRHGVGWIERQFGLELVTPAPVSQPTGSKPLPSITPQAPGSNQQDSARGSLNTITTEDQGDFLKITLLGEGNYSDFVVKQNKKLDQLVFTFNGLSSFTAELPKEINNTPVQNISGELVNNQLVLTIHLVKDAFVEYDANPFPNAMDIFFYRE